MIDHKQAPTLFPMEGMGQGNGGDKAAIHVELSARERAVVNGLNGHDELNGRWRMID